jgi:hypothetical protein
MTLQQHRSRHPVDALPALLALDASGDHGAVRRGGRHAFIDHLDGQARLVADGRGQSLGGRSLWTVSAVEPQREPDDDPVRVVAARGVGHTPGKGLRGLGRQGRERLSDGLGRVAQSDAEPLRPGIDRQDPQPSYGDAEGVGDAVAEGCSVVGGGTPDCTT